METIIALLFILLPLIFRLIGKKLEQSGQPEKAERMRKLAQNLGGEDDDDPFADWLGGREEKVRVEYDDDGQIVSVEPVAKAEPVAKVDPVVKAEPVVVTPQSQQQVRPQTTFFQPVQQMKPKASAPVKQKRKPMLEEEVVKKKGEKIDPKKLVIYSEIMKPKFTE